MQCRVIIGTLALDRVNIMLTMNCEKMINQATTYIQKFTLQGVVIVQLYIIFLKMKLYCDLLWVEYYFFANLLA